MNLLERLREKMLLAPGVYDALTALIAEKAGAEAVYLSGASIAYSRLGRPDIGLVSLTEVADTIAVIRDRISVPIIADADNGFGNALNVQRTVRMFERMGANALQLEDQSMPKRCGHLRGKKLISRKKIMMAKIIKDTSENFCAAPFCKRAERKAIPKSSLLAGIYSF